MNNPYARPGLLAAPRTVGRLLSLFDERDYESGTDPERFSVRGVIAHLADWETVLRGRLESALREPGITIDPIDEFDRALEMNYAATDPLVQTERFTEERNLTVELMDTLRESQFDLWFVNSAKGVIKVSDMPGIFLGHDAYHIEQLTELLDHAGRAE